MILAGDHHQLPPTVCSAEALARGFGSTMFERLFSMFGDFVSRMLVVQYRMHETIMKWSSETFYENRYAGLVDENLLSS